MKLTDAEINAYCAEHFKGFDGTAMEIGFREGVEFAHRQPAQPEAIGTCVHGKRVDEPCRQGYCFRPSIPAQPEAQPAKSDEAYWRKCPQCKRENSVQSWEKNNGKCPNCDDIFDKEDREASEFAAMANEGGFEAQPAPDVIERMLKAYWGSDFSLMNGKSVERMAAAAQVLVDEALGPMTNEDKVRMWEVFTSLDSDYDRDSQLFKTVNNFLANRRALAAKPQQETREQQVTAILQETVKVTNNLWFEAAEKVARVREGK